MTENLKKFLEALSGNAELIEKVNNAKSGEEIAELAKTLGFSLTEEDFKAPEGEVSDDELEGVAGGLVLGSCACFAGGGGGGVRPVRPICDCVANGGGISSLCLGLPGNGGKL